MSTFKILEYGERADSLWGIENKEITELELEALLEGKRLWTDINWEYAITIRLKDRLKELDIDRENKRLNSIINEIRDYIEENKIYADLVDYEKNGEYYIDEIGLLEILDKVEENK